MTHIGWLFLVMILLFNGLCIPAVSTGEAQAAKGAEPLIVGDNAEYAGSTLLNMPLIWKPTETISARDAIDLTAFQQASFTIKPFTDLRRKPAEIGKNVEKRDRAKDKYVTTRDDVAVWLADRFGRVLSEFEVTVVKENATLSLEAEIVKFYVTEESVYKADIGLKVRARSKSGDVIWEGMLAVSAQRWGSSYKAENYNEALSNACIDLVYSLLKNESFQQAARKSK